MLNGSISKFFWPPIVDGDYLDAARRRCLIVMCLCAGVIGLVSGLNNFENSLALYPVQTIFGVGAPLVILTCPFLIALTNNLRAVAIFFLAISFVAMTAVPLIAGGMFSRATFFMLPWAMMATLFLGWRSGIGAAAIVIGCYALLFGLRGYISPSVYEISAETISGWLFFALSLTLVALITGAAIFQREMEQAARRLTESRQEAQSANQAKSDFLARMSHEIRTPMNGILGMAELLQTSRLDGQQKVFVDTISASSETLLSVINDILDLSKIEAGQLTFVSEPFSLTELMAQTKALFAPRFAEKGVEFSLAAEEVDGLVAIGDAARIRQILINLIGNALKFTEQGSVCVSLEAMTTGGVCALSFVVDDTGVGIPAGKIDAIFDNFSQAEDTTTRRFGGTGLGLAISRQLARSMGGDISASSIYGEGSTFIFRISLPYRTEMISDAENDLSFELDIEFGDDDIEIADAQKPQHAIPAPEDRVRLLIAEDNEVNQLVIRHMIDTRYYDLETVENGADAVAAVERGAFDLIFMDVSMPIMDGYDATIAIRRYEAENSLARTPIICLTAHALNGQREKVLETGMDDYLSKPVRRAQIDAMLEKWTGDNEVVAQEVA